ncbi:NlpC/P60 family protein [Actinopolymorpha rutila]|uniref:Cell wall-associated NlpC family hydrolase n=1 Tax=Actinopolymorpha rutila TaxID=446787 RepID=A0A852ZKM4_9ACTN|nr:cell wall-associated NlpC family hydrolase [Actinopolymorpha rutila]
MRESLALLIGVAVVTTAGPAAAEPPDPPSIPSRHQVEAARGRAEAAAADVGQVQARLAEADARLRALDVAAQTAVENYDTAVYGRTKAGQAASAAAARADRARRQAEERRREVARLAVADYSQDGRLTEIVAYLDAEGPRTMLDRASTASMVSTSANDAYQRLRASQAVSHVLAQEAAASAGVERRRAAEADKARQQATAALSAQTRAVGSIEAGKAALVARLAELQNISTDLATKRQAGLAEQARRRAEAARLRAQAERARSDEDRARDRADDNGNGGNGGNSGSRDRKKKKDKRDGGGSSPGRGGSSRQGELAVAYALSQLGEPYVFGATGPGSWDCSGLTMRAWDHAGISMPHFARGQYWQSRRIGLGDLRPGDLLFWASNPRDSNTIYHVAMYIGNGKMVQAPRPGRDVEVKSMFYMGRPTQLARPR